MLCSVIVRNRIITDIYKDLSKHFLPMTWVNLMRVLLLINLSEDHLMLGVYNHYLGVLIMIIEKNISLRAICVTMVLPEYPKIIDGVYSPPCQPDGVYLKKAS